MHVYWKYLLMTNREGVRNFATFFFLQKQHNTQTVHNKITSDNNLRRKEGSSIAYVTCNMQYVKCMLNVKYVKTKIL